MVAIDTETSGLDLWHGARPYFVTTCYEDGHQVYWEWNVDPLTRKVAVLPGDLEEISRVLVLAKGWGKWPADTAEEHVLVGQNIGFDVKALQSVGVEGWPWEMTRDTLLAGHLLASNQPHNLTDVALHYLGVDILPCEAALRDACTKARRMVQQARLRLKRGKQKVLKEQEKAVRFDGEGKFHAEYLFGEPEFEVVEDTTITYWLIAKEGNPDMPSVRGSSGGDKVEKDRLWKNDGWLPRAFMKYWRGLGTPEAEAYLEEHSDWDTVLRDYANTDSAVTLALWKVMRNLLQERGLWKIYLERLKLLPVVNAMESRGVTVNRVRLEELQRDFTEQAQEQAETCVNVAASMGHELQLPKGASPNDNLRQFCFDVLKLPPVYSKKSKTAAPTLDKTAMEHYLVTLPLRSKQLRFVQALRDKRKRDTALGFLEAYRRFGQAMPGFDDYLVLHPNLNVTGTDTLRMSSSNPNGQQISKQEDGCLHCEGEGCDRCHGTGKIRRSLRWCFGPAPGREWWSLDYENIELRIPAYESGERCMIDLFERPDEPPYFGSYHLLNCSLIYPELFWPLAEKKGEFKKRYGATWYQWGKNFGFAFAYGCGEGTGDAAAHRPGAYKLVVNNLKEHTRLTRHWIDYANKHGYVETMPDKTVDPTRGYPIMVARNEWSKVSPTVPLCYRVSGTAMWVTSVSMPRCHDYLRELTRQDPRGYYLALQVHDEMVFDFPHEPDRANLSKVMKLKRLMELVGQHIGVPIQASVTYNPVCWGEAG
jgi:DNA polymerase I-like protein with 3'-5' exonuclease and polymerase domains